MSLLTFVVPVYNKVTFISDCLKSLINQSLKDIEIVWHNLFFEDDALVSWASTFLDFVEVNNFCSTYMLISRALHPLLIYPQEPSYDAKINKLALNMPNMGDFGYQKIYVFRKRK